VQSREVTGAWSFDVRQLQRCISSVAGGRNQGIQMELVTPKLQRYAEIFQLKYGQTARVPLAVSPNLAGFKSKRFQATCATNHLSPGLHRRP